MQGGSIVITVGQLRKLFLHIAIKVFMDTKNYSFHRRLISVSYQKIIFKYAFYVEIMEDNYFSFEK